MIIRDKKFAFSIVEIVEHNEFGISAPLPKNLFGVFSVAFENRSRSCCVSTEIPPGSFATITTNAPPFTHVSFCCHCSAPFERRRHGSLIGNHLKIRPKYQPTKRGRVCFVTVSCVLDMIAPLQWPTQRSSTGCAPVFKWGPRPLCPVVSTYHSLIIVREFGANLEPSARRGLGLFSWKSEHLFENETISSPEVSFLFWKLNFLCSRQIFLSRSLLFDLSDDFYHNSTVNSSSSSRHFFNVATTHTSGVIFFIMDLVLQGDMSQFHL